MDVTIAPLERDGREAAAALLARRHAAARRAEPALPARYEAPDAARELLDRLLDAPGSAGVIAWSGRRPAGFLAGLMRVPSPLSVGAKFVRPRTAIVPYEGYALDDREDGELYRELYAALAPVWVERGYFSHSIEIATLDFEASEAFGSLGFGRQTTLAVRRVTEPVLGPAADGAEVRRAGPADLQAMLWLSGLLGQHHASSPTFLPYLREPDRELEQMLKQSLEDPIGGNFIATRGTTVIGMQTFRAPGFISALTLPADSTYLWEGVVAPAERRAGVGRSLLAASMRWAEVSGFRACLLHFLSANLVSARFWQANGFWPLTHTLVRNVDERIAWAGR